jgi:hypothetical protein
MITIYTLNKLIDSNPEVATSFIEQIKDQISKCYSNIFDGNIDNFKSFILNDLNRRNDLKEGAKLNVDSLVEFIQAIDDNNDPNSGFNSIATSIINKFIECYDLAATSTLFSIFDYNAVTVFSDTRGASNIKSESDLLIKGIESAIGSISRASNMDEVNNTIKRACLSYAKLAGRNQAYVTGEEVQIYMLNRGYIKSETIQGENGTVLVFSSLEQEGSKLYIANNRDKDHPGNHWFCVTPSKNDASQDIVNDSHEA